MVEKLTLLDATILPDHTRLTAADECYFWREYTSGRNYAFGPGNDLVSNLKKKPSRSSAAEMGYKRRAIAACSGFFRTAIHPDWLNTATFVPIPGSKAVGDPDFDDRMTEIFRGIRTHPPIDVRKMIVQVTSTAAAHESASGERPTVEDLIANYQIDPQTLNPAPTNIGIIDDVLTAGVHYRAVHTLLRAQFPTTRIVGFFVARRVFPPEHNEIDLGEIDLA
ncbi:hypothetical protein NKH47_24455 [Mesorhizobium sp. M1060]|uniref:hypothetical protein n=1 Tax=Mesorhizobium sp. M1060 TaxID=2957052 RepID=UPI003337FDAA